MKAAHRKDAKMAADARKAEVDRLILGDLINYQVDPTKRCYCDNDCSALERTIVIIDDGWRGCAVVSCNKFFCNKLNCQKKLLGHTKICMQKIRLA